MNQRGIPYMQFRGGSSKGLYFLADDLPKDPELQKEWVLLALEGTLEGDHRQINGLGGGQSLTSKAAVVGRSTHPDADVDYWFLQGVVGQGRIATGQTCGNILAGVAPFAIEAGLVEAQDPLTPVRVNLLNTGGIGEVIVETPGAQVNYAGSSRIDGVPGTAAPVLCNYLNTAGSTCGALLPSGKALDEFDGYAVTCIDNGMPVVLLRASDFGLSGYETIDNLNQNQVLKNQIESIRLQAGVSMNLGDVSQQTIPKMALIAPAQNNAALSTRMFIPHVVHDAIGVLAAASIAAAIVVPGSLAAEMAQRTPQQTLFSLEHPSGECSVQLSYTVEQGQVIVEKTGILRTARLLSKGVLFLPTD